MTLPYDYARCIPFAPCADKGRCARHTSPSRPEGWQSCFDASAARTAERCESFIDNAEKD